MRNCVGILNFTTIIFNKYEIFDIKYLLSPSSSQSWKYPAFPEIEHQFDNLKQKCSVRLRRPVPRERLSNYLDTSVVTSDSETTVQQSVVTRWRRRYKHTPDLRACILTTYTAFLSQCLHFKEILQTLRRPSCVVHIYIPIIQRQTQ